MNQDVPEDTKPEKIEAQFINIKVVSQDGTEIFFKIKSVTPLKKLMDAYCKRQGLSTASVRFVYDGNRLSGTESPQKLGMENEDVIDVLVEQTGGVKN